MSNGGKRNLITQVINDGDKRLWLDAFDPKTLKMAYSLIGYKVEVKDLNENSSPSEILGLKEWERNNIDHIRIKHKNLVNGFRYLKDNMDVPENLYEIIVSILDESMESLEQDFKTKSFQA